MLVRKGAWTSSESFSEPEKEAVQRAERTCREWLEIRTACQQSAVC